MSDGFPDVAFVHDWLVTMRGGEQVLAVLHRNWPDAPIYTLLSDQSRLTSGLKNADLRHSYLQKIPGISRFHRWLLPFYPAAAKKLQINTGPSVVISVSHSFAKGVPKPYGTFHLCYCLTPMRYAWQHPELYFPKPLRIFGLSRLWSRKLKQWDLESNRNVDRFVAISTTVQKRIKQWYGRESDLIYPPVHIERFLGADRTPQDFYLVVSALVPYKRVDLAVAACKRLGKKLVIVGDGPCRKALQLQAQGSEVEFLGYCPAQTLESLYAKARALIYPQEEDFGIASVEAQAARCPVIAFRGGGALDTVVENETGLFFDFQSDESLMDAMERFEKTSLDPWAIRRNAFRFDEKVFEQSFRELVRKIRDGSLRSDVG